MGLSGACIIFENYKYLMGGVLKFINKKKISMKQIQFIRNGEAEDRVVLQMYR